MKQIYLDYAAATPMDKSVLLSMEPYFSDKFYNPSASYLPAKTVRADIVEAKKSIASRLGAKHNEIIHTSGGTEANNLAISGVMESFPGKKMLASSIEHESVLNPAAKYRHRLIPVDKYAVIDFKALSTMISDDVVLISIMLISNEVGSIQPIKEVAGLISRINKTRLENGNELPLYLHVDATQAPCYLDINVSRLGVDLMTLNGGKIYGPKQSGILFARTGVVLKPQILGGKQQRNLRSGTESPASVVGFAAALNMAAEIRKEERTRLENLRIEFINGVLKINPKIIINGHPKKHAPHIISMTFPGVDNERLLFQLEERGILAAAGSACSASSDEPSHVLSAMGCSAETARSSLRFSFGRQTSGQDTRYAVEALDSLLA